MATLYIEEYNGIASDNNGKVSPVAENFIDVQLVTVSASTSQSSAIDSRAEYVRLVADVACHYKVGDNPTATTSDRYLPANVLVDIATKGGEKIAVIAG